MGPGEGEGGDREPQRLGAAEDAEAHPPARAARGAPPVRRDDERGEREADLVGPGQRERRAGARRGGREQRAPRARIGAEQEADDGGAPEADGEAGLDEDVGDLDRVAEASRRWRRRPAASATGVKTAMNGTTKPATASLVACSAMRMPETLAIGAAAKAASATGGVRSAMMPK